MLRLKGKKLLMLASAAAIALPMVAAMAATTSVPVTVTFRKAISLSNVVAIAFDKIDYAAATGLGATDNVVLSTAGGVTSGGTFTTGAGNAATAGSVDSAGDAGAANLTCSTSALLKTSGGAHNITADTIVFKLNAGSDVTCSGSAQALTLTGTDTIKFGATLKGASGDGTGAIVSGAYSTANAGTPISVTLDYQ